MKNGYDYSNVVPCVHCAEYKRKKKLYSHDFIIVFLYVYVLLYTIIYHFIIFYLH